MQKDHLVGGDGGGVIGSIMQLAEDYADEAVNHGLYAPATYRARARLLGALLTALDLPQEGEELVRDATDYPTLFDRTNNPTDVNTLLVPFRDMERILAAITKAQGGAA